MVSDLLVATKLAGIVKLLLHVSPQKAAHVTVLLYVFGLMLKGTEPANTGWQFHFSRSGIAALPPC